MRKLYMSLLVSVGLFASSSGVDLSLIENKQMQKRHGELFRLAKSGDVDAQTILGEMYLDGIGVKADSDKAFYWLSKASQSDDAEAEYLLGFMYENGIKVDKNLERAATLYERASKQGDVMASYNLALMYKDGKGVEKDTKKAFNLLKSIKLKKDNIKVASK